MVLTDDPSLAERSRSLRNLCFRPERRFFHTDMGDNYRLTNLQAALGLAQMERIDWIIEKKRWMGRMYTEKLCGLPGLQLPVEESWAQNVYWMYGVVLNENIGMDAEQFARGLKVRGIDTRPFFLGMHEQPVFLDKGLFAGKRFPVAERIARQGLYLPSGLALSEEQLDQVCSAVREMLS
jgi:perosamine synthetase